MSVDDTRIRQRLEQELYQEVRDELKSAARLSYEAKLKEWEGRYLAKRSIRGLMETGQADPENNYLDKPFVGAADIGHPIEMTLIQELIPNVMTAHMGATPFTESRRVDERGLQPAGQIDDFLYYALTKANTRAIRRKTLLSAYKYGEGIEKLIMVPEVRTVTEDRIYLLTKGKKPKVLFSPDGEPVEQFDPETDITNLMDEMLSGEDPRGQFFRMCGRKQDQGGLGLSPNESRQAAGLDIKGEIGDQSVRVAPLVEGQNGQPMADWGNSATYYPTKQEITEDITISVWPKFIKVPTKDFLWPTDAKTNDIMDFWVGHRYNVELDWLIERKKVSDKDIEGFYEDVVDSIVKKYVAKDEMGQSNKTGENSMQKDKPEVWEIYGKFPIEKDDPTADNYLVETEIIAWFCGDEEGEHPLLGWMVNPANRYEMHHIKPLFVFQPKPEDESLHGLCIPETCAGGRDTADWLLNSRLNRSALYTDPTTIMDPNTFALDQDLTLGLGKRLVVADGGRLEAFNLNANEQVNIGDEQGMILTLRLLWGASEQFSGHATQTDSGTATEANLIAAKGAQMFNDTAESISQVADTQYEYIRQYYLNNDPADMEIPTRGDSNAEAGLVPVTRKFFSGPLIIRSRRVLTEAERTMRIGAIKEAFAYLANSQNPMIRNPEFLESATKEYFDALNLENIKVPSAEELQKSQAKTIAMAKQMEEMEDLRKQAAKIPNNGNRKLVETFLENPKQASKIGMPATSNSQAPGMPQGGAV